MAANYLLFPSYLFSARYALPVADVVHHDDDKKRRSNTPLIDCGITIIFNTLRTTLNPTNLRISALISVTAAGRVVVNGIHSKELFNYTYLHFAVLKVVPLPFQPSLTTITSTTCRTFFGNWMTRKRRNTRLFVDFLGNPNPQQPLEV